MTEAQHQKAVFDWSRQPGIRSRFPELALLYHIPHGGSRDAVEAKHLKQQGVKSGVPDLCLPVARDRFHALYIEMKTERGRVRPEQSWWMDRLMESGNFATVCRGWESAVQTLEWYLRL